MRTTLIGLANIKRNIESLFCCHLSNTYTEGLDGLIKLVGKNKSIQEVCGTYDNLKIICSMWSMAEIRDKLSISNTTTLLYIEMVKWLYVSSSYGSCHYVIYPDFEDVFYEENMQFLQKLAFMSLKKTKSEISLDFIYELAGDIDISDILNCGILKTKTVDRDELNTTCCFIHEIFREFFAACYIKNKLISSNVSKVENAFSVIRQYKNDPAYIQVIKFLSGLVSFDVRSVAVSRFWEALLYGEWNGDREDKNKQITLLIDLLSQSSLKDGKADSRVPRNIMLYVDFEISNDIMKFCDVIYSSGYYHNIGGAKATESIIKLLKNDDVISIITGARLLAQCTVASKSKALSEYMRLVSHHNGFVVNAVIDGIITIGCEESILAIKHCMITRSFDHQLVQRCVNILENFGLDRSRLASEFMLLNEDDVVPIWDNSFRVRSPGVKVVTSEDVIKISKDDFLYAFKMFELLKQMATDNCEFLRAEAAASLVDVAKRDYSFVNRTIVTLVLLTTDRSEHVRSVSTKALTDIIDIAVDLVKKDPTLIYSIFTEPVLRCCNAKAVKALDDVREDLMKYLHVAVDEYLVLRTVELLLLLRNGNTSNTIEDIAKYLTYTNTSEKVSLEDISEILQVVSSGGMEERLYSHHQNLSNVIGRSFKRCVEECNDGVIDSLKTLKHVHDTSATIVNMYRHYDQETHCCGMDVVYNDAELQNF